jgi:hypothetical protein
MLFSAKVQHFPVGRGASQAQNCATVWCSRGGTSPAFVRPVCKPRGFVMATHTRGAKRTRADDDVVVVDAAGPVRIGADTVTSLLSHSC